MALSLKEVHFKDVGNRSAIEVRNDYSGTEPCLVLIRYATLPFASLLLFSPKDSIWTMKVGEKLDSHFPADLGDDESLQLLNEELLACSVSKPIHGLLSLADDTDQSDYSRRLGAWCQRIEMPLAAIDDCIKWLDGWWGQLGSNTIFYVRDAVSGVDGWGAIKSSTIPSEDVDLFLNIWSVSDVRLAPPASSYRGRFYSAIAALLDGSVPALRISEELRCSLHMGHVGRDALIRSFRPSKRLAMQPNPEKLWSELLTRDELFALLSRLVNLLNSVSMYQSVRDALEEYSISVKTVPIAGQPEFDAMLELSDYCARVLEKYPILYGSIEHLIQQEKI